MSGGRIPAESFLDFLAVNVYNGGLSDKDFRQLVRNTLPIVEREESRQAGVVATMWAVREKGKNYPHTLPGIFRDEQEKYLRPCDELVKVTVEPV